MTKHESFTATERHRPPPKFMTSVPTNDDLVAVINHAEAALGFSSRAAFERSGARAQDKERTWSTGDDRDVSIVMSPAEQRLMRPRHRREVAKLSALRQRLLALDPGAREVLIRAYTEQEPPHETRPLFDRLTWVVLVTRAADQGLPADPATERKAIAGHPAKDGRVEWLLALCRKPGQHKPIIDAMRSEAGRMVQVALARWNGEAGPDVEVFEGVEVKPAGPRDGWVPDADYEGRGTFVSPRESERGRQADARAEAAAWAEVEALIGGQVALLARERGATTAEVWSTARDVHRAFAPWPEGASERADQIVAAVAQVLASPHPRGAFVRKVGA